MDDERGVDGVPAAKVLPKSSGSYAVAAWYARGTGTVWLRTRARDAAGNSVEQVIADAYRRG
ncbi:hypothetical protein [Micromonospora sp. CPCC 206061]|uniref:hypothetical protein n=1 Tax=Micromonospora sp. CPCC 206061 TaxID=3122410 RepID=UPI002FF26671